MTTRARYAEKCLAEAVSEGVKQCVVLGAGLDSLAYRLPWTDLTVVEVDHPATQAAKRERLVAAAIPIPSRVRYAPVDFTAGSLRAGLLGAGFDPSRPAFVTWLGVTQYPPLDVFNRTLEEIAGLSRNTRLVMEYLVPAKLRDALGQSLADYFMPRAAATGEPWINFLTPSEVAHLCHERGFAVRADVGRWEHIPAWLWERTDGLTPHEMGRLVLLETV